MHTVVIAVVKMHADRAHLGAALDVLRSLAEPTRAQRGCRACELWVDAAGTGSMLVEQRWEERADLESYMRSELFRRLMVALELADRPPEVAFFDVAAQAGMEWAASVRGNDR